MGQLGPREIKCFPRHFASRNQNWICVPRPPSLSAHGQALEERSSIKRHIQIESEDVGRLLPSSLSSDSALGKKSPGQKLPREKCYWPRASCGLFYIFPLGPVGTLGVRLPSLSLSLSRSQMLGQTSRFHAPGRPSRTPRCPRAHPQNSLLIINGNNIIIDPTTTPSRLT